MVSWEGPASSAPKESEGRDPKRGHQQDVMRGLVKACSPLLPEAGQPGF